MIDLKEIYRSKMNFCRVFEIPLESEFSTDFLFGGGKPVLFTEVDWFYPIPPPGLNVSYDFDSWQKELIRFIKLKRYRKPDHDYLILTHFAVAIIVPKDET